MTIVTHPYGTPWNTLDAARRVAMLDRLDEIERQHGTDNDDVLDIDCELSSLGFIELLPPAFRYLQLTSNGRAVLQSATEAAAITAATPATPQTTTARRAPRL